MEALHWLPKDELRRGYTPIDSQGAHGKAANMEPRGENTSIQVGNFKKLLGIEVCWGCGSGMTY